MKKNKIEKLKEQLSPWEYYQHRLPNLKADEIKDADIFYLKNFGIYTTKQNPKNFMLRLRFDQKEMSLDTAELILDNINENTKILLTARGQLELHGFTFEEVLSLHYLFKKHGLTSCQTLTDNARAIVTDPLYDIAEDSIVHVTPLIEKMQKLFLEKKEWCGMLPRKFNTAIAANKTLITPFWGNDCYFALAKKDDTYGFHLYVGGKNTHFAQECDIFVFYEDVVALYEAVLQTYLVHGLRASRTKARLYHLIEEVGLEKFKELLQTYYPKKWQSGGKTVVHFHEPSKQWFKLKDGGWAYRYFTKFGEMTKAEFALIIDFAQKHNATVRLGIDQNLYIINLTEPNIEIDSQPHTILACAGSKYCIYSLFDTKEGAATLPIARLNRHNITVGYSGCLKGCGRHIVADIGFVGIRLNQYGKVERGVRLYMGALHSKGTFPARLIFWAVPLRKLNALIETILDIFEKSGYDSFEAFCENEINQYEEEKVAYFLLLRMKGEDVKISELDLPSHETFLALQKELFSS
ncbi:MULTISPECIES: nitrite/sulfite reductase [unclassified Nitratiruptor]|uniref:nitrite/sulfite reductase n=1 Tax=unclassified Nitratiruptor TaxID=2624044 RepID=UPI001915C320|nr:MULTISPECIES: nitrite/sulfite reductase [unclassified Nitratiruptor]BCD60333.1 ferredoxin-nitrite reductase [Nitratiruptor sp. YY08-10]BCD64178.1 ferredoxin-nitrite reductase [Nitratiruptor sp. YY08-14]